MFQNIIVSICCFINILLIMIVYFSKQRIKNQENDIYSLMIIVNFFNVFVEILSYLLLKSGISYETFIYSLYIQLGLFYLVYICLSFRFKVIKIIESKEPKKYLKYYLLYYFLLYCLDHQIIK